MAVQCNEGFTEFRDGIMVKKNATQKKPRLKVDKVVLLEKLDCLRNIGQEMQTKSEIGEAEWDDWYNKVLTLLKTSFSIPENKFKQRFELPLAYLLGSPTGTSSVQDRLARIKEYFSNSLVSLGIIVDDISTSY